MKKSIIYLGKSLLVILIYSSNLQAQIVRSFEPESQGLGGSSVTNTNAWSSIHNQAAIPFVGHTEFSTAFNRTAGLKELGQASLSATIPLKNYGIGLSYQNLNYSLYHQSRLGVAIGLKLSEKLGMGVEIARYSLVLGMNYGKNVAYSGAISLFSKLSESILIGAQIQNLNASKLENDLSNQAESLFKIGVRHFLNDQSSIVAEFNEYSRGVGGIHAGFNFQATEVIFLGVGATNKPTSLTFSSGFQFGLIRISTSAKYSQLFGYEPSISLTLLRGATRNK